jgi:hypothetical protein
MIAEVPAVGTDFQNLKFLRHSLRHSDVERPNLFLKWGRMADALAKPVSNARFYIERKVISKRR